MNVTFLTPQGSQPRLLLLFAGWSAGPETFAGVGLRGYDVAVVWNYSDESAPWADGLAGYGEIAVVAWSFGVRGAAVFMAGHPELRFTARIAVNGTAHAVDPTMGIVPEIFTATLEGLNERTLRKFRLRMCGGASAYAEMEHLLPERPVAELKAELRAIGERPEPPLLMWDKAVIAVDDCIIPAENQREAWRREAVEIVEVAGPHIQPFGALVSELLTDKELVERRFSRSRGSYDHSAAIQADVARRLAGMLPREIVPGDVLEIGCGTGLSTRLLVALPGVAERLVLWDLDIPAEVGALGREAVECDAEAGIMAVRPGSLGLIFSSSTVQWFNSLPAFLRHAARALAPGGVMALSTFGPETMAEVHRAAGTRSRFARSEAILRMMPQELEVVDFVEERRTVLFDSPLDVLRHIRSTGVNGMADSARSATLARRLIREYPVEASGRAPLTYQPIMMILKKKKEV